MHHTCHPDLSGYPATTQIGVALRPACSCLNHLSLRSSEDADYLPVLYTRAGPTATDFRGTRSKRAQPANGGGLPRAACPVRRRSGQALSEAERAPNCLFQVHRLGPTANTASVPRFGQLGSFRTFDLTKLGSFCSRVPATDYRLPPFGFVPHNRLPPTDYRLPFLASFRTNGFRPSLKCKG